MTAIFASTSRAWFAHLRGLEPPPERVAFWRPSGGQARSVELGEPWFFKERGAPYIVGFGRFESYQATTPAQIWSAFGQASGAPSEAALLADIAASRAGKLTDARTPVGNVVLSDFTHFPVPVSLDDVGLPNLSVPFRNVPAGSKVLELALGSGLSHKPPVFSPASRRELETEVFARNAGHVAYVRRLYGGKCQVTGLPVLDGVAGDLTQIHHIQFLCEGGPDDPSNMMALCPDWHALAHTSEALFDWATLEFVVAGKRYRLAINRHLKPRT